MRRTPFIQTALVLAASEPCASETEGKRTVAAAIKAVEATDSARDAARPKKI